ncbi:hypothetical protein HK102_006989, partial [Quaeritorhiza haematococci]
MGRLRKRGSSVHSDDDDEGVSKKSEAQEPDPPTPKRRKRITRKSELEKAEKRDDSNDDMDAGEGPSRIDEDSDDTGPPHANDVMKTPAPKRGRRDEDNRANSQRSSRRSRRLQEKEVERDERSVKRYRTRGKAVADDESNEDDDMGPSINSGDEEYGSVQDLADFLAPEDEDEEEEQSDGNAEQQSDVEQPPKELQRLRRRASLRSRRVEEPEGDEFNREGQVKEANTVREEGEGSSQKKPRRLQTKAARSKRVEEDEGSGPDSEAQAKEANMEEEEEQEERSVRRSSRNKRTQADKTQRRERLKDRKALLQEELEEILAAEEVDENGDDDELSSAAVVVVDPENGSGVMDDKFVVPDDKPVDRDPNNFHCICCCRETDEGVDEEEPNDESLGESSSTVEHTQVPPPRLLRVPQYQGLKMKCTNMECEMWQHAGCFGIRSKSEMKKRRKRWLCHTCETKVMNDFTFDTEDVHFKLFKKLLQDPLSRTIPTLLSQIDDIHYTHPTYLLRTFLHIACQQDRPELAHRLLQQGADPTAKDIIGFTPLHVCVVHGRVECLRVLLEHSPPGERDVFTLIEGRGMDGVMNFTEEQEGAGFEGVVNDHENDYFDPAAFMKQHQRQIPVLNPLQLAVMHSSRHGCLEVLLKWCREREIDPLAYAPMDGETLVHLAAGAGCASALRMLIGMWDNVGAGSGFGRSRPSSSATQRQTSLDVHAAVRMHHVVNALTSATKRNRSTPLHLACAAAFSYATPTSISVDPSDDGDDDEVPDVEKEQVEHDDDRPVHTWEEKGKGKEDVIDVDAIPDSALTSDQKGKGKQQDVIDVDALPESNIQPSNNAFDCVNLILDILDQHRTPELIGSFVIARDQVVGASTEDESNELVKDALDKSKRRAEVIRRKEMQGDLEGAKNVGKARKVRVVEGVPALMYACGYEELKAKGEVRKCVLYGNDVGQGEWEGEEVGEDEVRGRVEELKRLIERLIDYGAFVNEADLKGITPLHLAAVNGLYPLVKALIDAGASAAAPDFSGLTPLLYAHINESAQHKTSQNEPSTSTSTATDQTKPKTTINDDCIALLVAKAPMQLAGLRQRLDGTAEMRGIFRSLIENLATKPESYKALNKLISSQPDLLFQDDSFAWLINIPGLLDFKTKQTYLRQALQPSESYVKIELQRGSEVIDAYYQLRRTLQHQYPFVFNAGYVGELGYGPGVTRDAYTTIGMQIVHMERLGLFTPFNWGESNHKNYFFAPDHIQPRAEEEQDEQGRKEGKEGKGGVLLGIAGTELMFFAGQFLALAVVNQQIIPTVHDLASHVFKALLGSWPPTSTGDVPFIQLEDLDELDPSLRLRWIKDEKNSVDDLGLDFAVSFPAEYLRGGVTGRGGHCEVELVPGGGNIALTDDNKDEYVDMYLRKIGEVKVEAARGKMKAFRE